MKQPSSPADPAAPGEEPAPAKTREVAPGVFEIFLPLPSKPTIINVWLVDCGGPWALIDTGVALQASRDIGAKRIVPIHFGTFDLSDESPDEPPRRLLDAAAAGGMPREDVYLLKIGETRQF